MASVFRREAFGWVLGVGRLAGRAAGGWWNNNAFRLAGSLAFYTLFSISPLLIVTVYVVDRLASPSDVVSLPGVVEVLPERPSEAIFDQLDLLIGEQGSAGLRDVSSQFDGSGSTFAAVVGLVVILVGCTAVFAELQDALNLIFHVKPKEGTNAIWLVVRNRLLGFGVAVAGGFLLLVSLLVSTGVDALAGSIGGETLWLVRTSNFVLSVLVVALLFALIYKLLPDAKLRWSDVAVGALVTSVLFNVGKYAIGFYLGRFAVGSAYGAAGSFAVFLLWVYYSALICFFGAEVTYQVVDRRPEPADYAEPDGDAEAGPAPA